MGISQGASLEGQRRTSELQRVSQTFSLRLGDFNSVVTHCSGTRVPWVCTKVLAGQRHVKSGNEFYL